MNILSVNKRIEQEGLNAPALNALTPDASNYSVLLFQPQGQIEATQDSIRNKNHDLALAQFGKFLEEAVASQPDLVVTPEYSMPWDVLREAISEPTKGPDLGKLWALGCESIKYSELQNLKGELVQFAIVLFEDMTANDSLFVDPLAYVFRTTASGGGEDRDSRLVVLVQFKTHEMADGREFEKNRLQLGTSVYQFGEYGSSISLVSLICSDVFAFTDAEAGKVYDRALILHIQLNPEPRHPSFLGFRERLLRFGNHETEILALNWASDVEIWIDKTKKAWGNIAASAWYGKLQDLDSSDLTLAENHRRGLYYTWLEPHRTHALFFNFSPATFTLTVSKVARLGVPAPTARRRGPILELAKTWDTASGNWKDNSRLDDGFAGILNECGGAEMQVRAMFDICPLACERMLALCSGNADPIDKWYQPQKLDSFKLDLTELIHRMTFCQDIEKTVPAFRVRRLHRCARLWSILNSPEELPSSLKDISDGFTLEWKPDAPHQNLRSHDDRRATVIYLGDDSDSGTIDQTYKIARERIRVSLSEEEGDLAKKRVAVWFRDDRGALHYKSEVPAIDHRRGESELDIGRAS